MTNFIESVYRKMFNPNYDADNATDEEKKEAQSTVLGAFVVFILYTLIIFFVGRWSVGTSDSKNSKLEKKTSTEQIDASQSDDDGQSETTTYKKKSSKKKSSSKVKKSNNDDDSYSDSDSDYQSSKSKKKNKKKKKSSSDNMFSPAEEADDIY